ncbi:DUF2834 domain-containing protein [Parvularcula lutaonensis]|uniref:DUF2834 domain-containing protein n=1 Tax=Parvularcula lutaonensis TaxID=491923 RepID=A0ABV7M7E4_9PROT|nr:DUF2834 domain-containing protein [Parvularcula lutaonensis]
MAAFRGLIAALGAAFTLFFLIYVLPPALESGDIVGAFAAGFVNPFAAGYSLDTIICGLILIVWILYERSSLGIRHGWVFIPVAFVPGVATAFAGYLLLRMAQLEKGGGT